MLVNNYVVKIKSFVFNYLETIYILIMKIKYNY